MLYSRGRDLGRTTIFMCERSCDCAVYNVWVQGRRYTQHFMALVISIREHKIHYLTFNKLLPTMNTELYFYW